MAAELKILLAAAQHHHRSIPAHIAAQLVLNLVVARALGLKVGRDGVQVGRVRRERRFAAGAAKPCQTAPRAGSGRARNLRWRSHCRVSRASHWSLAGQGRFRPDRLGFCIIFLLALSALPSPAHAALRTLSRVCDAKCCRGDGFVNRTQSGGRIIRFWQNFVSWKALPKQITQIWLYSLIPVTIGLIS